MNGKSFPIEYDRQYGPYVPERWVPAPRYVLRRDRILHHLGDQPRGDLLEVGYGSGALLHEFSRMGFRATGWDSSQEASDLASRFAGDGASVELFAVPRHEWASSFDYLCAFEVLEHIEDDLSALRQWAEWLKPGGALIIAVPSHPWLWGRDDELVGHYRRYTRRTLARAARSAGLEVEKMESYGFPLGIPLKLIRNLHSILTIGSRESMAKEERSARSGTDRALAVRLFRVQCSFPVRSVLSASCWLQKVTRRAPAGDGLLLFARRPLGNV